MKQAWEYSYDLYKPTPVETPYTDEIIKEVLSNFFVESYVDDTPTKYYSGVELRTATCENLDVAEVGFVGRTLLNAFNALEYGEGKQRADLVKMQIVSSILICGMVFLKPDSLMRLYTINATL